MTLHMRTPAGRAGALECLAGHSENSPSEPDKQNVADLALLCRARLKPAERLRRATAYMMSLPALEAEWLARITLEEITASRLDWREPAGPPVPAFWNYRDEARNWCALACTAELKAYFAAIWQQLPEADRASFLCEIRRCAK